MPVILDDNVIHPFPSIEQRATRAMADYKDGIADEAAGKARAIRAVIEYGKALLEGRHDGKARRSNIAFSQWVSDNKLDVGKPWDERHERNAAMLIANIVGGNVPPTKFDACPYTTPTNIMKWYRKEHPSKSPEPKKQYAKTPSTPQTDAAYEALVKAKAEGRKISKKPFAKEIGISHMAVEKARDRWNREQAERTEAKADEDAALARAETTFSEKSKLTIADAIRIHKTRLNDNFNATVTAEVIRRIAAANDSARVRLRECEKQLLQFERERGKRGVFSKKQFKQLQICCHPDASASAETRAMLLNILVQNEARLVNPEKP